MTQTQGFGYRSAVKDTTPRKTANLRANGQNMQSDDGTTRSEQYLAHLCRNAFLRLWSWPNLFRDQKFGSSEGKELCDLLVVFENQVFIFSDKHCAYPITAEPQLDWSRWFKRAVMKSADQVWGAERWIRSYPDRIFTDRSCTQRFPLTLPKSDRLTVHRIVVAHGSSKIGRRVVGGSGSLMIVPSLVGSSHFEPWEKVTPFAVGRLSAKRGFVHVIDDVALSVLLQTLDTVADLGRYLGKKQDLVLSGRLGGAAGEEDLLGCYLRRIGPDGFHDFVVPPSGHVFVDSGFWDTFRKHPDRAAQVEADQISYSWDKLIDKFAFHLLKGDQHFKSHDSVGEQELALRMLAREPRIRRRMLSKSLHGLLSRGDKHERFARVVMPSLPGDPHYLMLSLRVRPNSSENEYREIRRYLLESYCLAVRLKYAQATAVVGIATEPASHTGPRSEDFAYLARGPIPPELLAEARRRQTELRLLEDVTPLERFDEPEYPRIRNREAPKGRNRNKACICGSGLKYKRCCGQRS